MLVWGKIYKMNCLYCNASFGKLKHKHTHTHAYCYIIINIIASLCQKTVASKHDMSIWAYTHVVENMFFNRNECKANGSVRHQHFKWASQKQDKTRQDILYYALSVCKWAYVLSSPSRHVFKFESLLAVLCFLFHCEHLFEKMYKF